MKSKIARKRIFFSIKALVILSPLPFGCVGEPWRYIFFTLLAFIAFYAWGYVKNKEAGANRLSERTDPARELLYGRSLATGTGKRGAMVWSARLWCGFFIFCIFQLLPLPAAIVKVISPHTVEIMTRLRGATPGWLTLSHVPRETLVFALEILVWTVFGLVLARLRPGWREMTGFVRALGWSAALQVFFGLIRILSGSPNFFLFFAPWRIKGGDLTGTLVNSNHFAFFLELAAPLILAMIIIDFVSRGGNLPQRLIDILEHRPRTLILMLIMVLIAAGVVLSNSRAGLTALVVGVIVAALMMMRTRSAGLKRFIPFLAGLMVVLILVGAGSQTWRNFNQMEWNPEEGTGRVQRWPSVVEMARDFPFMGTGMGTFRWAYFPYDKEANQWVTHAHNDVLEIITEGGAAGALLFFGAFFLFCVGVITRWRRRNTVKIRLLASGGIAAVVAAFFHSLFDFSLRVPSNALALVLILALTWRVVNYKKQWARNLSLRDGGSW